jgi:tetratricopeptide (TPR) repeat protein
MCKYSYIKSLALAAIALFVFGCSGPNRDNWLIPPQGQLKELPKKARKAIIKANKLYQKGKYAPAVKNYDRFLRDWDSNKPPFEEILEREYGIAMEFLGKRRIPILGVFSINGRASGEKIMERISEKTKNKQLSLNAGVAIANSYEVRGLKDNSYYEAAHLKWLELLETNDKDSIIPVPMPTGVLGKDAILAMGRCKYLAYKGPDYDASFLNGRAFSEKDMYDNAINCYKEFTKQYPQEAKNASVESKLDDINEHLAEKDFKTGIYYQKTDNMQAANLYYQMVVRQWPQSDAAKRSQRMLASNMISKREK